MLVGPRGLSPWLGTIQRRAVVAARGQLPGLRPQLRRQQRRRGRRPARASPRGCPTCATSASTRSGSRRSTPRRSTTTGTTSPTTATSTRCSAPSSDADDADRARPRARAAGDRRPRPQPHLRPARRGSRRRWPPARAARSASATCSATRTRSTRQLPPNNWKSVFGGPAWTQVRRTASGTSTSSTPPSPTSTGATPRSATCSRTCCASGSTAASTASGSTSPTASSRRPSLRDQVLRRSEPTGRGRRGQHGRARTGRDEPMWDQPEVHEVYRRWHKVLDEYDGDRMAVAEAWTPTAGVDGRLRPPRRAAPGVQLLLAARAVVGRRRSRRSITGTLDAVEPGRRLPHLGAEQPRRRPARRRGTAAASAAWPAPGRRR